MKNSDYCNCKIVANILYIVSKNLFDALRLDPMKNITIEDVKEILRIEVKKLFSTFIIINMELMFSIKISSVRVFQRLLRRKKDYEID